MPEPGKPSKLNELSMEMRLLLAFLLMGAVLFLTPLLYKKPGPTPADKTAVPKPAEQSKSPAPPPAATTIAPTVQAGQIAAPKETLHRLETELYAITFSNRGANVRSWVLKKYKDSNGGVLDLVSEPASKAAGFPMSIAYEGQAPPVDLNQALFVAKPTADKLGIDFEFSDGRLFARKSFRFLANSYLSQMSSEVTNGGSAVPHFLAWRGGFGDRAVQGAAAAQHVVHFDPQQDKLISDNGSNAEKGVVSVGGAFTFAGVADTYFGAVFLPAGNTWFKLLTSRHWIALDANDKGAWYPGAAVGGDGRNRYALFVGPKDYDLIGRIEPKLQRLVDFGFWSFLARPLFLSLNWLNDQKIHNYGWTIVIVTIIINIMLFPLRLTSLKSTKKMQAIQPEVQKIQEKYRSLPARDPKKLQQNQEIMAIYQKHGVNPVSGCVPLLLQMPFLFAFYAVLTVAIEMRGASWLWVGDLSLPETIPIRVLPIVMIITQFIQTKMTPTPSVDPAQQRMMMFMPLVFGFMFYSMSSGLVLYWLTGNLIGIVQQWFFNRMTGTAPVPAAATPAPKKRPGRK